MVEFEAFNSLSVSAPGLFFGGSFLNIQTGNDAVFQSDNDTVLLQGGHNFDVNAREIAFFANDISLFSSGELLFLSREHVNVSSTETSLSAGAGGVSFASLAGSVDIQSGQSLTFDSNSAISFDSDKDISFYTSGNSIFTADDIYITSENTLSIDSTDSIAFVSSTAGVLFDSHDLAVTVGSLTANGGGQALIQSLGDELNVFGYLGVDLFSNGDIVVVGESDGAAFVSSGPGGVSLTSTSGNAVFTSRGASDESEVYLEAAEMNAESGSDFIVSSGGSSIVTGDKNIAFTASDVDFQIRRDASVFNEHTMKFTAGTTFGVSADLILLASTRDLTADDGEGGVSFSALTVDVTVGNTLVMTGGGFEFTAGTSDINLAVDNDLTFEADSSDGRNQEIDMEASDVFFTSSRSFSIEGGDIYITGSTQDIDIGKDLEINALYESDSSYVAFQSTGNSNWNVASFEHESGNTFFGPIDATQPSDITLDIGGEGEFIVVNEGDITLEAKQFTLSSVDDTTFTIGRDFLLSGQNNVDFITNEDISIETDDFYSSSQRLEINAGPGNDDTQDLFFNVGGDFILSTDRNEATDDFISFTFSEEINFVIDQDIQFVTLGDGSVSGDDINLNTSNDVSLSGSELGDVIVTANNIDYTIGESMIVTGESLTLNGVNVEVFAEDMFVDTYSRGVYGKSGTEPFTIQTTDSISISSRTLQDEILFHADNDLVVEAGATYASSGTDYIYFNTDNGDLTFDSGDINVFASRNMSISTGDDLGDTLSFKSATATITAEDLFSINISDGLLSFQADDTITLQTNTLSFMSTDFTSTSSTLNINSLSSTIAGGNIDIKSTVGNVKFSSEGVTSINSKASSIHGEEFDNNEDGISFVANSGAISITNTASDIVFTSKSPVDGDITMTAKTQVTMDGANVSIFSNYENLDIISKSASGAINIRSTNLLSTDADGDWWMTAAGGLSFKQEDFKIMIDNDFGITAEQSSILINHLGVGTGVLLEAADVDGSSLHRDNTIQIDSTQASTYVAEGGINFLSSGWTESRRGVAGDSNSELEFDKTIGFSARTYDPEGHIIFDSRSSSIVFDAKRNLLFNTDETMLIDTLQQQNYYSNQELFMIAEDGEIYYHAALGIFLDGANNPTFFEAYQYTNMVADGDFINISSDDFDFIAHHSDIEFTTFNNADININSDRFSDFIGGSELEFFSQGDLLFTSTQDFQLVADRGFSLTAYGDLISFVSTQPQNKIDASEEIYIQAADQLVLTNAGNGANNNMKFIGDGVVFSTTGGDMSFDVGADITYNMETMLIHAIGTNAGGRDGVKFTAPDSIFTATKDLVVDASETVRLGFTTNPSIVTFRSTDADATTLVPGIQLTSGGNIEFDSDDNDFVVNAPAENVNTFSRAQTSLSAATAFTAQSTNAGITFEAKEGLITTFFGTTLTETITKSVAYSSGVQNTYKTGAITYDVTPGTFTASGFDLINKIDGNFESTVTGANAFFTTTKADGTMDINVDGLFDLDTNTIFDITADDLVTFDVNMKTTMTIAKASQIIMEDFGSSLYFDSLDLMSYVFPGVIDWDSVSTSIESASSDVTFESVNDFTQVAGDDIISLVGSTYTLTALSDGIFNIQESFRVNTDSSVTIRSNTGSVVTASASKIITQPGGEGSLTLSGNVVDISGNSIFFNSEDAMTMSFTTSADLQATGATGTITYTTTGERSPVILTTPALDFDTTTGTVITAGDSSSLGRVVGLGGDVEVTTVQVNLIADAKDIAGTSSIVINGANSVVSTFASQTFSAQAGSSVGNDESQQGTINFSSPEALFTATTAMDFDAYAASAEFYSSGATNFNAPTRFDVNTHGSDSGILIEVRNAISLGTYGNINIHAGMDTKITQNEATSLALSGTAAITINTSGPSPNEGAGIVFRTESEDASITLAGPQTNFFSNDEINAIATDAINFSGALATITAPRLEFTAKHSDLDQGTPAVNNGIVFNTPILDVVT